MDNRITNAAAGAPDDSRPARTITVKTLIIIILLLTIAAMVIFGYLYSSAGFLAGGVGPITDMARPPEFIFSVYEGKNRFFRPISVTVDDKGRILVSNNSAHTVEVLSANGKPRTVYGSPGRNSGQLLYPYGVGILPDGNILIAETGNYRVQEFDAEGKFVRTFIEQPNEAGLQKPGPVVVDSQGNIYIGDLAGHRVFVFDRNGKVLRKLEDIRYPHGIAIDEKRQRLYVSDSGRVVVKVFALNDDNGKPLQIITEAKPGKPFSMIRGLAVDGAGRLYVADTLSNCIRVFSPSGEYLFSFGSQGYDDGQFLYPNGVYIDKNNKIYIADWGNNRISVWGYLP